MAATYTNAIKSINMDLDVLHSLELPRAKQYINGLAPLLLSRGIVLNTKLYNKKETTATNKWSMAMNVDTINGMVTIEKGVAYKQGYYIINDEVLKTKLPADYLSKAYWIALVIDLPKYFTYTGSAVTGDYKSNYDQLTIEFYEDEAAVTTLSDGNLASSTPANRRSCIKLGRIVNGTVSANEHYSTTYSPLRPFIMQAELFRNYKADTFTLPNPMPAASVIIPFNSAEGFKPQPYARLIGYPAELDRFNVALAGYYRVNFAAEVFHRLGLAGQGAAFQLVITRPVNPNGQQTTYTLGRYVCGRTGSLDGFNASRLIYLSAGDWVTIRVTGSGVRGGDIIDARLNFEFVSKFEYQLTATNTEILPRY